MNIDLVQARRIRNVDYFLGALWFCLGVYLAYTGYHTLGCFYMCIGHFGAFNAWTAYSFKELDKGSGDVINRLKKENDNLRKIIDSYNNELGYDDYEGNYDNEKGEGYVE
jgi:hypothetical protein